MRRTVKNLACKEWGKPNRKKQKREASKRARAILKKIH
jgi:hypothetical protein